MNALLVSSVNKRAVITDRNQFALSIYSKNNERAHLVWTPDPSGHARKCTTNNKVEVPASSSKFQQNTSKYSPDHR